MSKSEMMKRMATAKAMVNVVDGRMGNSAANHLTIQSTINIDHDLSFGHSLHPPSFYPVRIGNSGANHLTIQSNMDTARTDAHKQHHINKQQEGHIRDRNRYAASSPGVKGAPYQVGSRNRSHGLGFTGAKIIQKRLCSLTG